MFMVWTPIYLADILWRTSMKRNNLQGKEIGFWKVGESFHKGNKIYYHCTCVCGKEKDVQSSPLITGKSLSCGCKARLGKGRDLTGMDFWHLHVEEPVIINNHTYYRCSCKCGGSTIVKASDLTCGNVKTCGCRKGAGDNIREAIKSHCVDGTYIPGIVRTTINKNNTSGCRGVSFRSDRNKWRAYIKFQRKTVFLGYFDKYEDAVLARKIAEKEYFGKYLE